MYIVLKFKKDYVYINGDEISVLTEKEAEELCSVGDLELVDSEDYDPSEIYRYSYISGSLYVRLKNYYFVIKDSILTHIPYGVVDIQTGVQYGPFITKSLNFNILEYTFVHVLDNSTGFYAVYDGSHVYLKDMWHNVLEIYTRVKDVSHSYLRYANTLFEITGYGDVKRVDQSSDCAYKTQKANEYIEICGNTFLSNVVSSEEYITLRKSRFYTLKYSKDQNCFIIDFGHGKYKYIYRESDIINIYDVTHDSIECE